VTDLRCSVLIWGTFAFMLALIAWDAWLKLTGRGE